MILTLLVILLLFAAWRRGWRRGLVKEILFTLGNAAIFLIALYYDSPLGNQLLTWSRQGDPSDPMAAFVAQSLAFTLILFVGHWLIRALAQASQIITWLPVIKQTNQLAGALIALVLTYLMIYLGLTLLNMIQPTWFITQYQHSQLAQFILTKTPLMGQTIINELFHTQTQSFVSTGHA